MNRRRRRAGAGPDLPADAAAAPSPARSLVPALVVVALVAAVAATSRAPYGGGGAAPAVLRHIGVVVYLLVMPLAVLVTLALLMAALFQRRSRRPPPEQDRDSFDALRHHWLARLLAWALPALVAGLLVLAVTEARRRGHVLPALQLPGGLGRAVHGSGGAHGHSSVPTSDWVAALVIWIIALTAAALVALRALRRRRPPPEPAVEEPAAEELVELVDTTLEDIRREPDPRRAVVAAYAGMETTLARQGLPRRQWEAPFEFLARVLGSAGAGEAPLRRLTELFEHARFSPHPVGAAMKEEAIAALERVRGGLARGA